MTVHGVNDAPVAVDGARPDLAMVLIHARRIGDQTELRISRLEHDEWIVGQWQPVTDDSVSVRW